MKITLQENNIATIHDQLDEQRVPTSPINVKDIHFLFYVNEKESDSYKQAQIESILFSLFDWGLIDNVESIKVAYDFIFSIDNPYTVDITIRV